MFIDVHAERSLFGVTIYRAIIFRLGQPTRCLGTLEAEPTKGSTVTEEEQADPIEEETGTDPVPQDGLPSPSRWRKRLGLAGVASVGGVVAWLFGRRDKPPAD